MVVPACEPGICSWGHLSYCPILTSLLLPFFLLVCLPPSFLPCFSFLHSLSLSLRTFYFMIFQKKRFLAPTVCEAHCWFWTSLLRFVFFSTSLLPLSNFTVNQVCFLSIRCSASLIGAHDFNLYVELSNHDAFLSYRCLVQILLPMFRRGVH